jgi:glycosyltransferase involved in cell wall biosynthesis
MRVAFDARSLCAPVLRGWDRYTVGLVRELIREGVEVTLLHQTHEPIHPSHLADMPCSVVGLDENNLLRWEQRALPRELRRSGYDLYHAPAEHGIPLFAACPSVLTFHSVTWHSYADLVRRKILAGRVTDYLGTQAKPAGWNIASAYMQAQIRRARHIFTPSDYCRDEVIKFLHVAPLRVTTTPLAVHRQFLAPPRSENDRRAVLQTSGIHRPFLLYVGGYEPHKNVNGLLETFALVKAQRPDLMLVLVGSKTLPETIPARANNLGLTAGSDVVFLVDLTTELTDLYDEAELFVTMSWRETFCLPALEAMTRGLPVVASSWGATPKVLGNAGVLIDPRDTGAAAQAIVDALAPERQTRLRTQTRPQADKFSWPATAAKTISVYERIVAGR